MRNNLGIQEYGHWKNIEDHRWRRTTTGMTDGVNANLLIDDAIKAEGPHRVGGWTKSGIPVYFDEVTKSVKFFNADAKTAGETIYGLVFSIHKITDELGEFFETIPVAVQTRGEIYAQWLPVEIDAADLPSNIGNTIL